MFPFVVECRLMGIDVATQEKLFRRFQYCFRAQRDHAKSEGKFTEGIGEIRGEQITVKSMGPLAVSIGGGGAQLSFETKPEGDLVVQRTHDTDVSSGQPKAAAAVASSSSNTAGTRTFFLTPPVQRVVVSVDRGISWTKAMEM